MNIFDWLHYIFNEVLFLSDISQTPVDLKVDFGKLARMWRGNFGFNPLAGRLCAIWQWNSSQGRFNSFVSGRYGCNLKWVIFTLISRIDILWNWPHVNGARPRWWLFGSGNGLVPPGVQNDSHTPLREIWTSYICQSPSGAVTGIFQHKWLTSSGHQLLWHWLCKMNPLLFSTRKNVKCPQHLGIDK